jgi:exopolyphosphatase/guanosine-5'-triphosphate,3'-diphosphate pyrophosphatase
MVIARLVGGELHIIDRLKENVRLAAGLDEDRRLTDEARRAALDCLHRFSERLHDIAPERVRVVGTNTLRRARNAGDFRVEAERVLGRTIEIVSGQEEGRLVYFAVGRDHALPDDNTLVVDIGGGSTELIVGRGREMVAAHSLYIGCVAATQRYFAEGGLDKATIRRAETATRLELQTTERPLKSLGWKRAIGTSGTINAIGEIVRAAGWSDRGITLASLKRLRKELQRRGRVEALDLPGLKKERRDLLAGGLSILLPVFDTLGIDSMLPSGSALREGVLYDLVGRLLHDDARDQTIRRFVEQYHIDRAQAERVEKTATRALRQVVPAWGLDPEHSARVLGWAARLHEIGLAVAYSGYHKHGAYLIANSFMPGFSADEQALLAALVRGHRRKIGPVIFESLQPQARETALRLCLLLRIAALLNRSRHPRAAPGFEIAVEGTTIELGFSEHWLAAHPLTRADLDKECAQLRKSGYAMRVVSIDSARQEAGRPTGA